MGKYLPDSDLVSKLGKKPNILINSSFSRPTDLLCGFRLQLFCTIRVKIKPLVSYRYCNKWDLRSFKRRISSTAIVDKLQVAALPQAENYNDIDLNRS